MRSRMKRISRSAAGVGVPKRETRAMALSGSAGKPSSGVSTLMPGRIVLRASAVTPSPATTAAWRAETAALVQRLEQAVVEASPGNRSCAISNRSPITGGRAERYPRASVQVRLRCGNPELAAVLHSLETGTPRLFVDNLNILSQRHTVAAGAASGGVDVSFDLSGYVLPQAGTGAGAGTAASAANGGRNAD